MKLSTEDGTKIIDPSKEDIARLVQLLNDTNNKFLILEKDELTYMQAYGSMKSNWLLEYQAGSATEHFNVTGPSVTSTRVVRALQQYLEGIGEWKTSLPWSSDYEPSIITSQPTANVETIPANSRYISKIILVFLTIGFTILGIGFYIQFENIKFAEIATPVQAEVVALLKGRERAIKPVYLFLDAEGRLHRYVYHVASYPAPHSVGDIVTLHVNFSAQEFPDESSVKNLESTAWISTLIIKFGVLYVLIIGLVYHVSSIGGELYIKDKGAISSLFAQRKSPKETRIQMSIFYFLIFLFGVAGYFVIVGIIGFMIGIVLGLYAFALLRYLVNSKSIG